jgi:hypothetical protein
MLKAWVLRVGKGEMADGNFMLGRRSPEAECGEARRVQRTVSTRTATLKQVDGKG